MKQGKINWFDVATTLWAVALVVAAVMWVVTPASADADGVDCMGACVGLDKCEDAGGCATAGGSGGECFGECGDGTSWDCGYYYAL